MKSVHNVTIQDILRNNFMKMSDMTSTLPSIVWQAKINDVVTTRLKTQIKIFCMKNNMKKWQIPKEAEFV